MKRATAAIHPLIPLALATGAAVLLSMTAYAQSSKKEPMWVPLTDLPTMLQAEPNGRIRYAHDGTPVKFYVDPNSLAQILSKNLSTACAQNKFNQKQRTKYFVPVKMPDGKTKRFGFAGSNGFNLRDPNGMSGKDQGYIFDMDGTSECRVYTVPVVW